MNCFESHGKIQLDLVIAHEDTKRYTVLKDCRFDIESRNSPCNIASDNVLVQNPCKFYVLVH